MNEENLLAKIMTRIQQEKKIGELRKRLFFFSFIAAGSAADLGIGKTVMVNGKTNSDGSVTVDSIQLRP